MSEAIGTLGTTLKRGLQHIAQVQDVSGPDLSTDTDKITNHDSPDGVQEFIQTIKHTGEITFPLVFLPSDPSHDDSTAEPVRAARDPVSDRPRDPRRCPPRWAPPSCPLR